VKPAQRFALLSLACISQAAFAETIQLKDGTIIRGSIATMDEQVVTIDTSDLGRVTIKRRNIQSIRDGVESPANSKPDAPVNMNININNQQSNDQKMFSLKLPKIESQRIVGGSRVCLGVLVWADKRVKSRGHLLRRRSSTQTEQSLGSLSISLVTGVRVGGLLHFFLTVGISSLPRLHPEDPRHMTTTSLKRTS
jgi:hypothetical protein